MPVQRLDALTPMAPAQAAAQSAEAQRQQQALTGQAQAKDASVLADAQKSLLQSRIAATDAALKKSLAEKQLRAQQMAQMQSSMMQFANAQADRKQRSDEFDKQQQFRDKVFDFEKGKASYDESVDAASKFLERTASLPRNEDGSFQNAGMNEQLNSLLSRVDETGAAFGRKVSGEYLRANSMAIGQVKLDEARKEAFRQHEQAKVERKIVEDKRLADFSDRYAGNMIRAASARGDVLAKRLDSLAQQGFVSPTGFMEASADAMGATPELKDYLRLKMSAEPGSSARARAALKSVTPEELMGFETAFSNFVNGVEGTDGIVNLMEDAIKAGGVPSGNAGVIRNSMSAVLRQLRHDAMAVPEQATRRVSPPTTRVMSGLEAEIGDDPPRKQAAVDMLRGDLAITMGPFTPEQEEVRSYFSTPNPTQEQTDRVVGIALAREDLDRRFGTQIALKAIAPRERGGLSGGMPGTGQEGVPASIARPSPYGEPESAATPEVGVPESLRAPGQAPQPTQGQAAPGSTPTVPPARPATTVAGQLSEEDIAERRKFEEASALSTRNKASQEKRAKVEKESETLFEERRAELASDDAGIVKKAASGLGALMLGEKGLRSTQEYSQKEGLLRGGVEALRKGLGFGRLGGAPQLYDEAFKNTAAERLAKVDELVQGDQRKALDKLMSKKKLSDADQERVARIIVIAEGRKRKAEVKERMSSVEKFLSSDDAQELAKLLEGHMSEANRKRAQKLVAKAEWAKRRSMTAVSPQEQARVAGAATAGLEARAAESREMAALRQPPGAPRDISRLGGK